MGVSEMWDLEEGFICTHGQRAYLAGGTEVGESRKITQCGHQAPKDGLGGGREDEAKKPLQADKVTAYQALSCQMSQKGGEGDF